MDQMCLAAKAELDLLGNSLGSMCVFSFDATKLYIEPFKEVRRTLGEYKLMLSESGLRCLGLQESLLFPASPPAPP